MGINEDLRPSSVGTLERPRADFRELAVRIRNAGLLDRRRGYYALKISLTVAAYAAGWAGLFLLGDSWFALGIAAFLGIAFTQLGFIGHDAGHHQVFASRLANTALGLAVGNAMIGVSYGWWVPKHSAHHAHPNELGRDPDLGEGIVVATGSATRDGVDRHGVRGVLARWSGLSFFPLMLLRSAGLHVSGLQRLARRRDRRAALEAALITVHAGLFLAAVFVLLSPVRAIAFVVVQQAVFSVYLGCSFAPNHKGMPIVDPAAQLSFLERQVLTARNVTGGRFTNFALGGLNYQIEHHLFPSMPRPNLARAQRIVRPFCIEWDLAYREAGIVGSFRQIFDHVAALGSVA
jgi:fatty acid desaturase